MRTNRLFVCLAAVVSGLLTVIVTAQTPHPGRQTYASRCAGCHGTNGNGGELGPSILARVPARTDEELTAVVRQGLPGSGMPAAPNITDVEMRDLIGFLR